MILYYFLPSYSCCLLHFSLFPLLGKQTEVLRRVVRFIAFALLNSSLIQASELPFYDFPFAKNNVENRR